MTLVNFETGEVVSDPDVINYEVHPAAMIFPLIEGDEFDAFVEDIRRHGQMEPVVLDSLGRLIDGRNRVRACQRLGIDVKETRYAGDATTQFIISHNLRRRHLTDGQRAMVAAKLAERREGRPPKHPDIREFPPSQQQAADLLNVKRNQVEQARKVVKSKNSDLIGLVDSGTVPVTTAARVATECDPDEQAEFVAKVNDGVAPSAAAPPDRKQQAKPRRTAAPPRASRRKGDQHASQIEAINNTMRVWREHLLPGITELDDSVTSEKAGVLSADLSRAIRELNRINRLLKERNA